MSCHHVRSRTLLLLLSILLTFTSTSAHIETDDNHDMLSMITPLEKVSQYQTIPRIIPTSASQTRSNQHPHLLYYEFKAMNRTWKVKAELNHDLFAPTYQELVWVNGKGLVPQESPQSHHDHCYYIGHVTNARNASAYNSASLYTCKGVHGIIHADNMMLHVQPSLTDTSHSIVFLDQHVKRGPRHHKCKHDVDHVEMDVTSTSTSTHMASRQFQSLQNMDLGRTRWVELIIVNDRAQFAQFRAGTTKGSSIIANQVDALYANAQLTPPLRVRLVAQITFQDEDPYQKLLAFHPNGEVSVDSLLAAFTKWSADPANNLPSHDNHQLISGLNFEGNVVGYAPVSQMCNIENSAAIVSHATQDWIGTALTSTHEMGHNLGMIHDGLNVAPQGRCPPSGAIMAAQSSPGLNITEFSVCSKLAYQNWYQQDGYRKDPNACLENIPTRIWAVGVCGDGKLEGTEECDCGPANSTECRERQPCCIPETCKFKPGATCSKADACCNIDTCQVRPKGTVCRSQRDRTCDIVETCDGKLPTCPDDTYQVAGGICNDTYSATGGRCYQGFCLSLDKLCSQFGAYRACPTSLLPDPTATSSCRQSYCLLNGSTTCEAKPDPSKTPGTIPDGYGCDTGKQCMSAKCVTSDQLDHPPVPTAPPTPIGTNGGITNPLTENNNLITILVIIAAVAIALSVLLCVYRRCRRQQAKRDIASGRVRYAAPGVYVDEPGIYVAPPLNQQNIQLNVYNSQPSNQILSNGLTVEEAMAIQQMQLADAQRAEQMKQEQAAAEAGRAREISIEPAEPARPIEFASDEEAIQALLAQEEADRRARDARRAEAGLPPLNEPLSADEKLIRDLLAKDAEALKAREARRANGGGSVTKPKNIPVVPTIVATPAPSPSSVPISFSPAPAPAGAPGGISIAVANDLPRGWTEHKTSQGVTYWFNSVTGKTAWSRPTE